MSNTFIIKENVLKEVSETMKVTPSQFNANVRYFLHQLLDDPVHCEVPTCIRMAGISRSRFIKMLVDRGIVKRTERFNDTDKDGNHKTPTMAVKYTVIGKVPDELEYKVSKNDFDRRVEKLRRSIFEKNLPQKHFNTRLGDHLAIAKNSPATISFVAPAESGYGLARDAASVYNSELDEEGGGATSCASSGQFSQPLFGMVRKRLQEAIGGNTNIGARYKDLGGGFDVPLENGAVEKSLVTIQNRQTNTLYHICFDGANFNIYRDMRDGKPCAHVSYVFDRLLDAFENNGYVDMEAMMNEEATKTGRVVTVTEEQMKLFKEAAATISVGGEKIDYQYTVPFPGDEETLARHNGDGGSVSINHINESSEDEYLEKRGIDKTKGNGISTGWCEKEQKWYGWSHRAIHGFGIGDKYKEYYPDKTKTGNIIKTLEQAKEAAEKFAESVS